MSQLVEKLRRLSQQKGGRMGFGMVKAPMVAPSFVLVAGLTRSQLSFLEVGHQALDAVLLLDEPGEQEKTWMGEVGQRVSPLPVGGQLGALSQVHHLREAGYDFVFFRAEAAPAALLELEEVGKFLQVEETMADGLLRAAARLPIDALAVDLRHPNEISVGQILFCQRCAELTGKPLAAMTSPHLSKADLVCLRNAGVKALVVTVVEGAPSPEWVSLRELATGLPPISRKEGRRVDALLPLGQSYRPAAEVEEGDEAD